MREIKVRDGNKVTKEMRIGDNEAREGKWILKGRDDGKQKRQVQVI